jgi:hypothetical protein
VQGLSPPGRKVAHKLHLVIAYSRLKEKISTKDKRIGYHLQQTSYPRSCFVWLTQDLSALPNLEIPVVEDWKLRTCVLLGGASHCSLEIEVWAPFLCPLHNPSLDCAVYLFHGNCTLNNKEFVPLSGSTIS